MGRRSSEKRRRRSVAAPPTMLAEMGAHGICERALDGSFFIESRIGVWICAHGYETKVSFGMPADVTPSETQRAHEAALMERMAIEMELRSH